VFRRALGGDLLDRAPDRLLRLEELPELVAIQQ
jgi:hypothetical protein